MKTPDYLSSKKRIVLEIWFVNCLLETEPSRVKF